LDTNYLLQREQISLMMARQATCSSSRLAHAGLARAYGALLAAGTFPHRNFNLAPANDLDPSESPDRGRANA
jgi:hypothetical protein